MNETVQVPYPHMNWFSVCDISYGQVFTDVICITKAQEAVSCAEMCAVGNCEGQVDSGQPKVVGAGPKSCGVRTSVNKEY